MDNRLPEADNAPNLSRRNLMISGAVVALGSAVLAGCEGSNSTTSNPPRSLTPKGVDFTVSGLAFRPEIELAPGSSAIVEWFDESGAELARGTSPEMVFGEAMQRSVTMVTEFADVLSVNLGFSSEDDPGPESLRSAYNKAPEPVDAVSGLGNLTNLKRFMAAHSGLSGLLDVSGLAQLQHIECYNALVDSVDLAGCDSLVRLTVERNRIRELDLNSVARSLRDLRGAGQEGGQLSFLPLDGPLTDLRHFCVGEQAISGHPSGDQLPACQELWTWGGKLEGHLPTPGDAHSVLVSDNAYTTADLSGQWTYQGGWGTLDMTNNNLATIRLAGCHSLQTIRLGNNDLDQGAVDGVLAEVSSWGTPGFHLVLDGTNAAPSASGRTSASELRDRGWSVALAT